MKRVGFVGLGTMGSLMCTNLLRAGFPVAAYDLDVTKVQAMVERGARGAASSGEAARDADVVITMLPASPNVEEALLGPEGALAAAPLGCVFVDMSTIDPMMARRLAAEAAGLGMSMLDAPVSGGPRGARAGTLSIIVGGNPEVLERCRDVLAAIGSKIFHMGENGMGQVAKLANNLISAASMVAVSEAFTFAVRAGADPKQLYDVISQSTGDCWVLRNRPPYAGVVAGSPADRDFAPPDFAVELMHKDVGLATATGRALGVPMFLGTVVEQLYAAAKAAGYGHHDHGAVSKVIRGLAGDGEVSQPPKPGG